MDCLGRLVVASLFTLAGTAALAQDQVAAVSGSLPTEPEIGAFTAVNNAVQRRYLDEAFAWGRSGGRTFANESVWALAASSADIRFDDSTELRIGPNSEILLDSFVYDPGRARQNLALRLVNGLTRFTTGRMDKAAYSIDTPVGSLSIRGTRFTVLVEPSGVVHLGLHDGALTMELANGETLDLDTAAGGRRFLSVGAEGFEAFTDPDGILLALLNELGEAFDNPFFYSGGVAEYMTTYLLLGSLENCETANSCLAEVENHFERLSALGSLQQDAEGSLDKIADTMADQEGEDSLQGKTSELFFEARSALQARVDAFPDQYAGSSFTTQDTQTTNASTSRQSENEAADRASAARALLNTGSNDRDDNSDRTNNRRANSDTAGAAGTTAATTTATTNTANTTDTKTSDTTSSNTTTAAASNTIGTTTLRTPTVNTTTLSTRTTISTITSSPSISTTSSFGTLSTSTSDITTQPTRTSTTTFTTLSSTNSDTKRTTTSDSATSDEKSLTDDSDQKG